MSDITAIRSCFIKPEAKGQDIEMVVSPTVATNFLSALDLTNSTPSTVCTIISVPNLISQVYLAVRGISQAHMGGSHRLF